MKGFLQGKAVWTRKKKIVITSLNFKCVKFINSVNKEKYYLHSSGPRPTIFYAWVNVFSSGYGMIVFKVFLLACIFIAVGLSPFGNQ